MNQDPRMKLRGSLEHNLHYPDTQAIDMVTRPVEDVDKKAIVNYLQNHFITMKHYYGNEGIVRDIDALESLLFSDVGVDIISLSCVASLIEGDNGEVVVDSPYSMRIVLNTSSKKQFKVIFVRKGEYKSAQFDVTDMIAIVYFIRLYANRNFGITNEIYDTILKDIKKKKKEAKNK
jgi:hypothetical protein